MMPYVFIVCCGMSCHFTFQSFSQNPLGNMNSTVAELILVFFCLFVPSMCLSVWMAERVFWLANISKSNHHYKIILNYIFHMDHTIKEARVGFDLTACDRHWLHFNLNSYNVWYFLVLMLINFECTAKTSISTAQK
jgi:hypothetical protein